ncbi:WAT1-related protein At5g13670-like isoform X1 [Olea europaea var. sylvestris]|uniref:WAT1-related protein At5g13670-like isoform X1 n=1 Tax=Olea europaea var. sylvestris TaxID=158386 RepID=UPI000C1CE1D0|nr:WAT1-related protein At5g13670-like isoform X1 [Olea europaea var. sylvestris]
MDRSSIIFPAKAMSYLAAIFLRCVFAGLFTIAKRALNLGMNPDTFTVYRNVIAAIVFGPLALVFERSAALSLSLSLSLSLRIRKRISTKKFNNFDRNTRPRMTLTIVCNIFLLGLFGVLDQNLYYAGMKHTTATFATTIYNFLPVINFLLACLLRLEKVKFRSSHGQAKVFGTLVSAGGVMVMTFIKGPVIGLPWTKHNPTSAANYPQTSVRGPLMILGACFFSASFNILQVRIIVFLLSAILFFLNE